MSFETAAGRHFYGHGVFSRNGRLLYATENDFEAQRGVIGIYDATAAFGRVGEFPSHGLGPHDVALLRSEPILVVANGGFLEHPDFGRGRRILNPGAISTSLAYIDMRTGGLLERHDLGAPGVLSLRHLDIARDDTVVLGAQIAGAVDGTLPLLYRHRRQEALRVMELQSEAAARMAGYVSSIAVDAAGEVVAATSSRGGSVLLIDIGSGRLLASARLRDVSGVAAAGPPGQFALSAGTGTIAMTRSDGTVHSTAMLDGLAWDNHVIALGTA